MRAMPLWDTVMIALVIGSTIAFCFWARIRATVARDHAAAHKTNIAKLPVLLDRKD